MIECFWIKTNDWFFIILLLYILIFCIIAVFFLWCMNIYDYTLPVCNESPCYLNDPLLGIWDSVLYNILPTVIISVSSVIIVTRVYYQKRRLHQPNVWRTQRKMTIQLLCVFVLYLILFSLHISLVYQKVSVLKFNSISIFYVIFLFCSILLYVLVHYLNYARRWSGDDYFSWDNRDILLLFDLSEHMNNVYICLDYRFLFNNEQNIIYGLFYVVFIHKYNKISDDEIIHL
jgi:Kef-type K+ transport system membrane component KefB